MSELALWLLITDPLTRIVDLIAVAAPGSLDDGPPVAVVEDGTIYRLKIIGSHVLIVGATGAGKGSVIWSVICQLASFVRAGVVRLWVIDPKGGMELAAGRPLFDRFCHGDSDRPSTEGTRPVVGRGSGTLFELDLHDPRTALAGLMRAHASTRSDEQQRTEHHAVH